jgi:hypothetical protein
MDLVKAVTVKICEGPRATSAEAQKRLVELVSQYGNEKAKARYGIDADSDTESDPGVYEDVKSALHIDDWVGNIDAELEVWELVNDCLTKRQHVVNLCYYCSRCFVTDFYRLSSPFLQTSKTLLSAFAI